VRWDAHAQKLVGPEAEDIEHRWVESIEGTVDAARKDCVVGSLPPQRSVGELGGKACVPPVEAMVADTGGQHQIRVGVVPRDSAEHLERHEPGRVCETRPLAGRLLAELATSRCAAIPFASALIAA
jgi:hypothetical protein